MKSKRNKKAKGFTLLELLLVAGILAVLAAFAVPSMMSSATEAKIKIAEGYVLRNGSIAKGLSSYYLAMNKYPDTDEGLAQLYKKQDDLKEERYKGPYMEGAFEELKDPWGNPFNYRSPGETNEDSYDLWSNGPNGIDDGGKEGSDDVKNWTER